MPGEKTVYRVVLQEDGWAVETSGEVGTLAYKSKEAGPEGRWA